MSVDRVLVSGVPGSGKSTLGRQVARSLGISFLDKDDYLEALFASEPPTAERSALSRLADDQFIGDAMADDRAVLVSFWRRPGLSTTSGTRLDWIEDSGRLVELFCDCPPAMAADRFRARHRHHRHDDGRRSEGVLLDQLTALASLGPLGLGRLVRVDTSQAVDVDAVVEAILASDGRTADAVDG